MDDKMKEIRNIKNNYGNMLFGMSLIQLMDVGHSNITDDYITQSITQIMAQGKTSILSPEFQCEIIRCAGELARYSPWTLFKYIKEHLYSGMR